MLNLHYVSSNADNKNRLDFNDSNTQKSSRLTVGSILADQHACYLAFLMAGSVINHVNYGSVLFTCLSMQ